MDIQFIPVAFPDIFDAVQQHLDALPSRIDSFLEEHILASRHYRIHVDHEAAGFASIHKGSLITQFALIHRHKQYGQPAFQRLRRLEEVQSAFVPTCDEFYLAHALDEYRQLAKQAYFFSVGRRRTGRTTDTTCSLQIAEASDQAFIQRHSGDFFEPIERYIAAQALFLVRSGDTYVGFGLLLPSGVYRDVASIGMYTISQFRGAGIGTATITLLTEECLRRELHAVAGCWYYNHASKKTLERAGMVAQTRLLKIEY